MKDSKKRQISFFFLVLTNAIVLVFPPRIPSVLRPSHIHDFTWDLQPSDFVGEVALSQASCEDHLGRLGLIL